MLVVLSLSAQNFFILVILGFVVFYYARKKKTLTPTMKHIEKLPGQKRFPIIGTSYTLFFVKREDLFDYLRNRFPLYYGMFRSWIGNVPIINLSRPEHAEIILNNSVHVEKSSSYDFMKPWLGEGLLTSAGQHWHTRRKLLTPAFHFKILESALETFNSKAQLLVEQLKQIPEGEIFDIYPYITHCALDIIGETAMGTELNSMNNQNKDYVDAIYEVSDICMERIIKPWLQPDIIFRNTNMGYRFEECLNILHEFTLKMINERRTILNKRVTSQLAIEDKQSNGNGRFGKMVFLDILLEESKSGRTLSDEDIRQEVDTFLFEGHDTTTAGICWAIFLLGNNLDIQERVYDEITDAFEGHEGPINMEVLGKLKLLERCIKESLRLYPSVPVVSRLLQTDVTIDGFLVPGGCTINLYIFMVHRDERYYNEPEKFDPDRFLPENVKRKHPFAFIPFSAGPRNCIGQKFAILEEKVVLAYILKNFKIQVIETEEMVRPVMNLVLRPLNGVKVLLTPRK